jgi:FkbM family methyltransferase
MVEPAEALGQRSAATPIQAAPLLVARSVRQMRALGELHYVPGHQRLALLDVKLPATAVFGDAGHRSAHLRIYEGLAEYAIARLRTYEVCDCLLAGQHLVCIRGDTTVKESSRGRKSFRDGKVFVPHENGSRFALNPDAAVEALAGQHLAVGGASGYYHWLTEILPRLVHCRRVFDLSSLPVLLRPPVGSYERPMLEALGISPKFSASPVLKLDSALLPTHLAHPKRQGRYSPELVELVREFRDQFTKIPSRAYPERIYVSRSDAASRRVVNEDEVMAVLGKLGFEKVVLSGLPIEEQIGLFSKARVIVGPHGAGLTNLLFSAPGAKVVELYREDFHQPTPFKNLAGLANVEHVMVLCSAAGHDRSNDSDLRVDCRRLSAALASMLEAPVSVAALPANARASYAQNGEDLLIDMLLGKRKGIKYVDVGCLFPDLHSNTYLHYLAGGQGVCIDPNPTVAEKFKQLRPRDVFINAGVSDRDEELRYYMHRNPVFNTFSAARAEKVRKKAIAKNSKGRELLEVRQIRVRPLMDLLSEARLPESFFTEVDLLSIDTEGLEDRVLRSIDFERFRPKLIVAEAIANGPDISGIFANDLVRYLSARGYQLRAYTGHDVYMMRAESNRP